MDETPSRAAPADPMQPVVEAIGTPAIVYDAALNIRAINGSAEKLLGVNRAEIVGQGVELTNSLYNTGEVRQARRQALDEGGGSWSGDWIKIHATGQELPSRVRVALLPGSDCFLEVVQGGADAPQSNAELERQLMAALVELSATGLVVADPGNQLLYGNGAFEASFNRNKRLKAGTPLARFFEPAEYIRLFGNEHGAGRTMRREPGRLLLGEGQEKAIRVSSADVADDAGTVNFRLLAVEDQSELEGSREDASLLMEATRHLSEALLFSDPTGKVFFANEAASRLFAIDEEGAIGTPITKLLGDDCLEPERATLEPSTFETQTGSPPRPCAVRTFPVRGRENRFIARGWVIAETRESKKRKKEKPQPSGS